MAANQERMLAIDAVESSMVAMQMENKVRDDLNAANARLLGYIDEINDTNDIARFAGRGDHYNEPVSDIEESRYYIIISAYNFRRLVDKNEKKLRWVTRMSIRVRGNKFGERVEEMVARAARYFGTNSGKLVREYEGTIESGEAEVIGVVEDPPPPPPATSETPVAPATPPAPAAADQPN